MTTLQQSLSEHQNMELLHLYDAFQTFGISVEKVATMTGIGTNILTNKFQALDAWNSGKKPSSLECFTAEDYHKIYSFAGKVIRTMQRLPASS